MKIRKNPTFACGGISAAGVGIQKTVISAFFAETKTKGLDLEDFVTELCKIIPFSVHPHPKFDQDCRKK